MKTFVKLVAAFSIAMAFAACQKESAIDAVVNGRTIKLTVSDNVTKTAYTPGVGVKLTGSEPIGLFYRKVEDQTAGRWNGMTASGQAKPVIATKSGEAYSFTIPAGAEYTEWTGILPYSSQNTFTDSQGVQMVVKLAAVQCPGQNTFDPAYDYLLAKNFTISEGDGSAQITEFKRIFAPLRLTLTGIDASKKIYAVTFASNQTAGVPDEGEWPVLVGQFNVNCSGEASQAKIVSVEYEKAAGEATGNIAFGNAVSAVYSEGLSSLDGSFPVWFMVNPSFVFNEDSKITVTVNTEDSQIVRTITLPEEISLAANTLNGITVNMAGQGAQADSHVVLTQVYNDVTKLSDATASDGKKYNWSGAALWNVNENNRDAGSLLKNALSLTNRPNATIPAVAGYKVKKVRLYAHIVTNAKYGTNSYLSLKNSEGEISQIPFNFCSTNAAAPSCLYTTGGIVDIECPEGVDNLAGLTLTGVNNCLVSAVAYYLVEDVKEYEEATGDDLWAEWNAGKKITINGVAYTKDAYPVADLVDVSNGISDIQPAGVHFVEGIFSTGNASSHIIFANGVTWIGRYKSNKPSITAGQFKLTGADFVFYNLNLKSLNSNNSFPNNNSVSANTSLVVSNCKVEATGGVVRDVNATYSYETLVFEKCNITYRSNNVYFTNSKTANSNKGKLFKMVDCTVNNNGQTGAMYNQNQSALQQTELDIVITGNDFTNLSSSKLVNSTYKTLTCENNTGYSGDIE